MNEVDNIWRGTLHHTAHSRTISLNGKVDFLTRYLYAIVMGSKRELTLLDLIRHLTNQGIYMRDLISCLWCIKCYSYLIAIINCSLNVYITIITPNSQLNLTRNVLPYAENMLSNLQMLKQINRLVPRAHNQNPCPILDSILFSVHINTPRKFWFVLYMLNVVVTTIHDTLLIL